MTAKTLQEAAPTSGRHQAWCTAGGSAGVNRAENGTEQAKGSVWLSRWALRLGWGGVCSRSS